MRLREHPPAPGTGAFGCPDTRSGYLKSIGDSAPGKR
jgi:hypothetical protein